MKKDFFLSALYSSYIGIRVRVIWYIYTETIYRLKQLKKIGWSYDKSNYYFHCKYAYGDNIQNIVYLNLLSKSLPRKKFIYGINSEQISQIREFIKSDNLLVVPIDEMPWHSIDIWKNRYKFWQRSNIRQDYYLFFMEFFLYFSKKINLPNPIINKYDLMVDVKESLDTQNYDILFINSTPRSFQFSYSNSELDEKAKLLSSKYSVITTKKVRGIKSTVDNNLSLYSIGVLSKQCKCIIAISTGPIWPVLNKSNFNNCKPTLILCDDEIINFNHCSLSESSLSSVIDFAYEHCQ